MDFTVNMSTSYRAGLVWFRRDLRTADHAALYHALRQCARVYCVFVFDRTILDALPRTDLRVDFIRSAVEDLDTDLRTLSGHPEGGLMVRQGAGRGKRFLRWPAHWPWTLCLPTTTTSPMRWHAMPRCVQPSQPRAGRFIPAKTIRFSNAARY